MLFRLSSNKMLDALHKALMLKTINDRALKSHIPVMVKPPTSYRVSQILLFYQTIPFLPFPNCVMHPTLPHN